MQSKVDVTSCPLLSVGRISNHTTPVLVLNNDTENLPGTKTLVAPGSKLGYEQLFVPNKVSGLDCIHFVEMSALSSRIPISVIRVGQMVWPQNTPHLPLSPGSLILSMMLKRNIFHYPVTAKQIFLVLSWSQEGW